MTKVNFFYHTHFSGGGGGGGGGSGSGQKDSSLFNILHDFLGLGCSSTTTTTDVDQNDDGDGIGAASPAGASEVPESATTTADKTRKAATRIRALLEKASAGDPFRLLLAGDVDKAAGEMASLRGSRPAFRRAVASRLREAGYDAAICQTRWRGTKDVLAGNYEYIDVVTAVTGDRYIVDVRFAAEFAVARPTVAHAKVLEALPMVLVARPKVVQEVVKVAAKAARRSLKSQGLAVPPWRKKRFMAAKWLGPHRRMTGTGERPRATVVVTGGDAMCRTVGFVLGPPVRPWLGDAL
ncbi:hypothetical protein ACP4OV_013083 [Aristida adscensionis]